MKKLFSTVLVILLLCSCAKNMPPENTTPPDGETIETDALQENATPDFTEAKEHTHTENEKNNVVEHETFGYCGNTMTTVTCHGYGKSGEEWEYSFMGGVSVGLTDFLRWLDYGKNVCKCLPEYTVTTEFGVDYGINLTEGYVRYNGNQVSLTNDQKAYLKEQIEKVYDGYKSEKMPGSNI